MSDPTDTNQASEVKRNPLNKSDEDVKLEPMTNQASEDVVDSILSTLGIVDRKSGNRPGQIQVVKQLIRTEKLKLLAEVREEAFSGGLSFELDDGQIVIEVENDLKSITTKLEAEL